MAHAQTPVGTAFTYQGRLVHDGQPANGIYDVNVTLMDSASGGTQIGQSSVHNDVQVVDGLFTLTLDFGTGVFSGDARWLQVFVRPGDTIQFYTALAPRQQITPAPHALNAQASAQWKTVGSGVTNANNGFVGVNRSTPASSFEHFGIQAPVQSGYGGMYIRTDGAAGKPFYGYSNGSQSAWTYFDGGTGNWLVNNGGDRLTVTGNGLVGVGTTSPSGRLHVNGAGQTDAVYATNTGANRAAHFHLPVGSSNHAVYGVTYGDGKAALFESHVSNAEPTVSVFKNAGTAIKTTGDVEVDGVVRTRMGSGFARGTPIAYGKFEVGPGGVPIITSSSGNVVGTASNGLSVVTILGETNPEDWLVTANLVVENLNTPVPFYRLITGNPDANGQIRFFLKCIDYCGSQPNGAKYVHFAVFKPY